MRILIANRGEIARRIIRTSRRLGYKTVAAYADPDAAAPFVAEADFATRLGPAALNESYLSADALLAAAARTGATAVHPGYGFLSESASFAREVQAAGLVWIGPDPTVIDQMGSKINARQLASAAGVATIPGFDSDQNADRLAQAAVEIGFPVLVKAAAGGGGKGIRIVHDADGFAPALAEAMAEASRSFGDDAMIVERYIQRPRHVEVQVLGDKHGTVIDLGTRECSVQRRYQKVLEEAPAPNLPASSRLGLRKAAVDFAASVGYDSAGTVEFVVDADTGDFFFLEMNTRLQVEHPVTEYVTGIDLVEQQLRSAAGEPLSLSQQDVVLRGHAFEARINAESPADDFAPDTGIITALRVPPGVRWDSGVELGSEISPFYDSMIAKLIVGGPDRETARRGLAHALDHLVLAGVANNAGFQRWLVDTEPVRTATVTTRFLDETPIPQEPAAAAAAELAAIAWSATRPVLDAGPWNALPRFRATPHRGFPRFALVDRRGEVHEATVDTSATVTNGLLEVDLAGVTQAVVVDVDRGSRSVAVVVAGHTHQFDVLRRSQHWAPDTAATVGRGGNIITPFPAVVVEVLVSPGDSVEPGQVLVTIEAMKMLHSLTATTHAVVDEVRSSPGDTVPGDFTLVTFLAGDSRDAGDQSFSERS